MRFEAESGSDRGEGALKWLVLAAIVLLAGLAALLWAQQGGYRTQIAQLQAEQAELVAANQALEEQRIAAEEARKSAPQDNVELVRLRGEVASLRPLAKQVQQLQAENQQLKATVQQLQQSSAESAALRTQNQQLQGALQSKAQADACIANLRQIEAAKAAWAAQFQKQPTDVPSDADLFGPGQPLPQKPVCPSGGAYTIGPVHAKPTCSVPGHAY